MTDLQVKLIMKLEYIKLWLKPTRYADTEFENSRKWEGVVAFGFNVWFYSLYTVGPYRIDRFDGECWEAWWVVQLHRSPTN